MIEFENGLNGSRILQGSKLEFQPKTYIEGGISEPYRDAASSKKMGGGVG